MKHIPLAVLLLFASCSGQITGQLAQDASGTLQVQAALEPNMIALIRSFRSLNAGGAQAGPILNAASLNRTLQAAPGVKSAALRNSGQERIEGTIGVSRIGDLLSPESSPFIRYEAPSGTAPGRVSIHLDRRVGPQILPHIAPEAVDFLSALMAPIATGEAISRGEYLGLVESVYGKAVADEIAASKISAVITFPGQIQSVKGGRSSGREARFELPLTDLLVLEQGLDYEVTWRS